MAKLFRNLMNADVLEAAAEIMGRKVADEASVDREISKLRLNILQVYSRQTGASLSILRQYHQTLMRMTEVELQKECVQLVETGIAANIPNPNATIGQKLTQIEEREIRQIEKQRTDKSVGELCDDLNKIFGDE